MVECLDRVSIFFNETLYCHCIDLDKKIQNRMPRNNLALLTKAYVYYMECFGTGCMHHNTFLLDHMRTDVLSTSQDEVKYRGDEISNIMRSYIRGEASQVHSIF